MLDRVLGSAFGQSASLEQINHNKLESAAAEIRLFLAHRNIPSHVDFITRQEAPEILVIIPDEGYPMIDVAEALKTLDSANQSRGLRLCDSVFVDDDGVIINACPDMIVGYARELTASIINEQAPAPVSP